MAKQKVALAENPESPLNFAQTCICTSPNICHLILIICHRKIATASMQLEEH